MRRRLLRQRNSVAVAFALGGVVIAAFGSRLPSIQASLAVSKAVIGTALMALTVGALTGLTVAARIHSRLGARRGIGGSLVVIAAGLGTVGVGSDTGHSLAATVAGLLAVGAGIGVLDVLINVEGAAVEQSLQKTVMPLFHACWSAGAILGAGLGAISAAAGVSVTWQFGGEGVTLLAAATYVVAGIPAHQASIRARPSSGVTSDLGGMGEPAGSVAQQPDAVTQRTYFREHVRQAARTWISWRLLLIGLVMLGAELGEGSANTWLTLAARTEHHHSEAVSAAFFMLFAIGETTARLLGGPLADRFGRVATVRWTSVAGMTGVTLFIVTQAWWLTGVGVLLWAAGVSMGFPLGMSAAAESGPNRAAQVSVVATIGYAANLAGPPTIGILADHVGLLRALWVVVVLLAMAAVCAAAVRPRPQSGPTIDRLPGGGGSGPALSQIRNRAS